MVPVTGHLALCASARTPSAKNPSLTLVFLGRRGSNRRLLICDRPAKKRSTRKGTAFFGAGDRTRTGTLSPAVDFESTTSTIPSHRQILIPAYIQWVIGRLRCPISSLALKSLRQLSTAAHRSGRFFRHRRRSLRSPFPSHRQVLQYYTTPFGK